MKRGFTLIELLVTISIIGILAGLVINNLADARLRARDTKRKSELTSLKTALRLYYNDFQSYPINLNNFSTVYIKSIPEFNAYTQTASGDGFIVKVTLENASDSDLTNSQTRCPGQTYAAADYVVCED